MATWQACFTIVPPRKWPAEYAARLDAVARRTRAWSSHIQRWGVEDGNHVDIYLHDGQPDDGLLRLDMRAWDAAFVADVLTVLVWAGCALINEAGARVEPNLGEVAMSARGSPAFRFVEDPERFLRRLEFGGLDDA